jgi:peroxiredoxin
MSQSTRMHELQQRFAGLAGDIPDGAVKEALSVLHGMIVESRREQSARPHEDGNHAGTTLEQVANLYKSAPPMEGLAEAPGLPAGSRAPDFTLPDANGRPVSLSDFRGRNVVLVFYPLDWSPACSDQLSLYQSELDEFERHNAVVLGISVDSLYSHGAWAAVRGLDIPLLADFHPRGEVARLYRVMRDSGGFSERALFVIDGEGVIRYAHVSPELHRVPDVYELFDQLKTINTQAVAA